MILKRSSLIKKIAAIVLTFCMLTGDGIFTEAATGYKSRNMNGKRSYTQFNCSLYSRSNFWDVEVHADGTSQTLWCGSRPFYADSITHNNILSCSGIGSMSIGGNRSGANFSTSVSGHTATWTYTARNVYHITVNYNY